jgi:hypothetical protein
MLVTPSYALDGLRFRGRSCPINPIHVRNVAKYLPGRINHHGAQVDGGPRRERRLAGALGALDRSDTSHPSPTLFLTSTTRLLASRAGPRPFGGVMTLTPSEARRSFSVRAREFLATRLAGLRRRDEKLYGYGLPPQRFAVDRFIGGPVTQVSGCQFSVNTRSAGLTAHWSGIYYISPNYLGAPTTPASGVLQGGTYVFGVSGRKYGASVQWDTNAVCSLPGNASVNLHY